MTKQIYSKYVYAHPLIKVSFGQTIAMTGERDFKSDFSIGMCLIANPGLMEKESHVHPNFDMYITFMGLDPNNIQDIDAEIIMYMGKEMEEFRINKATTIFIPKGLWHCPLDIKRVGKPFLFVHSTIAPKYEKTPVA